MSSRHQPENGADSPESMSGPWVVKMVGRWDDLRTTVVINQAWGKRDARNLAEDLYPEYVGVDVQLREVTQ